ncbi:uncharacterized protein LOC130425773 [Triplophysa dalaica]|uniref:uncharacterized protein LOC130425773 n=1 Tax=Triplophysa dalaica TaxID=1582913 RepID=UPI0024DF95BD|nr:uncharacterized protein LOC130425773 [Triplophysa dalaica]
MEGAVSGVFDKGLRYTSAGLWPSRTVYQDTPGFTVKGSSGPLVVPLGGSVLLPCSVDSLSSLEDLEVEWRRSDSQTLIHLYQDGDIRPEVQNEDYHDRAHFFTDDIKQGNFSLLLKNVRQEDEGQYTCKVHSGQESGETVVEIKDVERLIVSGSDDLISVYVGEDVTLNCSVDSHIPPEDIEEVSWKKRVKNEYVTVLLYQNNEVHPEPSDEQYRDRVEFFSDEIHRGNFSLRLKRVRTEDKGLYMCQVFAGRFSDNTTVTLKQLGFSSLHIMVLILCISACGSALLFFSLIFSRTNTGFRVEGSYKVDMGGLVVLPCFIDPHLITEGLKIKWRRSGLKSPVCVYEYGSEVQHQDYHDRAHFYTEDIKHGNFSLLLKNVKKEDEGQYICTVNNKLRPLFAFSVNLKDFSEYSFTVVYSCDLVVPLGGSVLLPWFNKEPFQGEIKKVEWSKSGLQKPVFVCEDGDIRPEIQHEDYRDRAHFISDDIKHGNFSLLLKNVRQEDKGEYTCKVYRGQESGVLSVSTKLEPRLLDSGFLLQMFLVFCPNLIMCFTFVFWGVSEGSESETICCCALYILRPLLLLWTAPYLNYFKDRNKTLIQEYTYVLDYFVLTAVVYSALFVNTWQKLLNFAEFDRVFIIIIYVLMFVFCSCKAVYILAAEVGDRTGKVIQIFDIVADLSFEILPTLQFILLFYTFASGREGIIIIAILPVLLTLTNERMFWKCYLHFKWSSELTAALMLIVTLVMKAVMIGFFIFTLENKTDLLGWACVIVFLQILWAVVRLSDQSYLFSISLDFHRFVSLYVFGSVGVVLIGAFVLITELILKTVNGERAVMDLRFILFPSECFFLLSVVISGLLSSDSSVSEVLSDENENFSQQITAGPESTFTGAAGSGETPATGSDQNTTELKPLMKNKDQDTEEHNETQPESVISQT